MGYRHAVYRCDTCGIEFESPGMPPNITSNDLAGDGYKNFQLCPHCLLQFQKLVIVLREGQAANYCEAPNCCAPGPEPEPEPEITFTVTMPAAAFARAYGLAKG